MVPRDECVPDGGDCVNACEMMLCWNPGTADVALVRHPDTQGKSRHYQMTALACNFAICEKTFEQRKAIVFIEAMHLIVRDQCDPMAVHRALLPLDEYLDGCALDMPGVAEHLRRRDREGFIDRVASDL